MKETVEPVAPGSIDRRRPSGILGRVRPPVLRPVRGAGQRRERPVLQCPSVPVARRRAPGGPSSHGLEVCSSPRGRQLTMQSDTQRTRTRIFFPRPAKNFDLFFLGS